MVLNKRINSGSLQLFSTEKRVARKWMDGEVQIRKAGLKSPAL